MRNGAQVIRARSWVCVLLMLAASGACAGPRGPAATPGSPAGPPEAQGPRPTADIQFDSKGAEFEWWIREFHAHVRRNWWVPQKAMTEEGRVVITMRIHRDGKVTNVVVVTPSAIDALTLAARNAITNSAPFRPLPADYPDQWMALTVTFHYNDE